jgi:hypothetical protein
VSISNAQYHGQAVTAALKSDQSGAPDADAAPTGIWAFLRKCQSIAPNGRQKEGMRIV